MRQCLQHAMQASIQLLLWRMQCNAQAVAICVHGSKVTLPSRMIRSTRLEVPAHHNHHQTWAKAHSPQCSRRSYLHQRSNSPLSRCVHPKTSTDGPAINKSHEPAPCAAVTRWEAPSVRAAAFTGLYATLAGMALTIAPITVFGLLFDSAAVPSGWIRVGGVLFTLIGMQYLGTSWADGSGQGARGFYLATALSRLLLVLAFTVLVIAQQCPKSLLVLAALNLAGAVSMLRALQKEDKTPPGVTGSA